MGKLLGYLSRLEHYDPGFWFQIPWVFLQRLSWRVAIPLAAVINIICNAIRYRRDRKGWVRLPTKLLMRKLQITERQAERLLADLCKAGFVQKRVSKTMPPRRYVYVDVDELEKKLGISSERPCPDEQDYTVQTDGNAPSARAGFGNAGSSEKTSRKRLKLVRRGSRRESSIENPLRGKEETLSSPSGVDRYREYAEHLRSSISEVRKIPTNAKIGSWAQAFRRLEEVDGYSSEEVKTTLEWFRSYLKRNGDLITQGSGPAFCPQTYSGQNFRTKFVALQSAMNRDLVLRGKKPKSARPEKKVRLVMPDNDSEG